MAADENNLVQRARRGDPEAFRTLMERYKRKVFAIAYGMVRDSETAMDISQEAFIKVYRYLETFQGQSSFYTWLYRIVVNLCIDHIRKEAKHDALDYDDMVMRRAPDDAEAWVVPKLLDHNPLSALDRKELSTRIAKAFEGLSEKHRAVLMLREIEGLSYEDIARTLGIHKGTVMSRLHHARRNLQAALQGYLEERGEGVPAGTPGALHGPPPEADEEAKDEATDASGA